MTPLIEKAARAMAAVPMWDGDTIGMNLTREEVMAAVIAVLKAIRPKDHVMMTDEEVAALVLIDTILNEGADRC